MRTGPWPALIIAAIVLVGIAIWSSLGAGAGRRAAEAIVEAQRHVAAVHEAPGPKDHEAIRAIDADLLVAQTAFNQSQFEVAAETAQRTSLAAQNLLKQTQKPASQ